MRLLERWAGTGAVALIVLAAAGGAMRLPWPIVFVAAGAGVALALGAVALSAKKASRSFEALAAANGIATPAPREDDGKRWFADRGFSDLAGQPIARFTVRDLDVSRGTVSLVEGFVGTGRRPLALRAAVLTAKAPVQGALCLYEKGVANALRAKVLGGSVSTGTPVDDKFVPFASDRTAAVLAAGSLDVDAVNGLLRRVRQLGARADLAYAVRDGRASVLADQAPAALLQDGIVREILETLGVSAGGVR
jgi:hypothetical protein